MSSAPERPAALEDPFRDGGRDLAPVEGLGALRAEALDRVTQLAEAGSSLPRTRRRPSRRVDRARLGIGVEHALQDLVDVRLLGVDHDALASQARRGRGPAPPAKSNRSAPGTASRPAGVPGTPHEAAPMLKIWAASGPKYDRTGTSSAPRVRPPRPGTPTKKSKRTSSSPVVDEHEPTGAEAGQRALGDERGEHGRHRRVDRVAPVPQDASPGLGGQRMARRHCPGRRVVVCADSPSG